MAKKGWEKEKPACPKCGSKEVIPILYGYLSKEAWEMEDAGEVEFGGLDLDNDNNPGWHCKKCGNRWK
ncbi:MAG: hypothetical protein M1269_01930 [Chloroflexi bacterium]|nr:hypothetical protein [Chloroflexota bacterium]